MAVLADFLDDLLGGLGVVAWSLAVGGILWMLAVLRSWRRVAAPATEATRAGLVVVLAGAAGVAVAALSQIAIKAWILSETLGRPALGEFLTTPFCHARVVQAALGVVLAAATAWLRAAPATARRWGVVLAATVGLVVNGAWLVHAASRLEGRVQLMALTVLHQLGGGAWAGGIAQLLLLWRLAGRRPELGALWPLALRRFAWIAAPSVALLTATGIGLARTYVGSWTGLVGTPYGAIIVTKIALFAGAGLLGASSFVAARRDDRGRMEPALRTRVPYFVEAEGLTLLALLLAAAALSAQPPAADMGAKVATVAEVVDVFAPRMPRLTSPPVVAVQEEEVDPLADQDEVGVGDAWAEFNHNVAGLILIGLTLLALLDRWGVPGARHWPLGFVGLAVFLLFRNDPEGWPLGPQGFWEGMKEGGILQHRLAVSLACVLGVLEWRARTQRVPTRLPYVFPVLAFVGGILLLTHSHTAFEAKSDFLLEIAHTGMGLLGIGVACGRLLELRLRPADGGWWAGVASLTAMLLIGVILVFYHEPGAPPAVTALLGRAP